MKKQKNIPALRFPEFKGEWVMKKLGDLLEFKNGINANKEQYGKGVKFINVLDILNNDFITYDRIIGSVDVDLDTVKKNSVGFGDILFQRSSETRKEVGSASVYLDKENIATFGGFVIRGKKIGEYDPVFLNKLLKTDLSRDDITSKSGGSTRYNVGQEVLSSVKLFFPNLPEQTKISTFLITVDDKIQQLTKKKELLQQYKKGIMQQIFNKTIRFKDDEGNEYPAWEGKRLGVLVDINKGEQLNREDLTDIGKYPCINGGMFPSGFTDKFNIAANSITISEGGNSCGFVNFLKTKFWSGGHCYTLKMIDSAIKVNYLFQILKFNESEIMKLRVGSGLPNIQKGDIVKFYLFYAVSINEQTKIANFLSAIDDKINTVTQSITQAHAYKKGLLQQMFV